MDVQKLTHEVRLQQWGRTVKECRSSGKSVKSWCAEQNINIKNLLLLAKESLPGNLRGNLPMNHPQPSLAVNTTRIPVFAELRKPDPPSGQLALTIQRNYMEIQIYRGADAAHRRNGCFLAIRSLC